MAWSIRTAASETESLVLPTINPPNDCPLRADLGADLDIFRKLTEGPYSTLKLNYA